MKNNNTSNRNNNNNNSNSSNSTNDNHQEKNQHDRRKQHNQHQSHYQQQQQDRQPHQQDKQHHQHDRQPHQQDRQPYQGQRERSGQRNQGGQYPDSSAGRDNSMNFGNQSNLGSIRFSPGYPTRELPPIETKPDPSKKFTGRCRLFVGNLAHNTTEEGLRALFDCYGEVGECFLGPKSAFAFIKMDTRQNAEAARDALDCSVYENRTLRVRLAAHAAAIRIKHISPQVTNELLAYAFRYFGEIERAVVVVDDKGKSIGEGVVEYSRKQSALYAIKRCQQECFMLTASPRPVLVEPYDQQDDEEGLPEKSVNKNSIEFKEHRDVGPRFAEQGTFEHTFALKWKELYEVEKQKRDRLEQEILEARKNLQDQIEYSRLEHDTIQLRTRLQQLEDDRLKLQHMKEQTMTGSQQREEARHQQDMLLRQREEEVLRRQQLGDPNGLNQQESALRMQANALQDILNSHERPSVNEDTSDTTLSQQKTQPAVTQSGQDQTESSMPVNQIDMLAQQMSANQPRHSFAGAAMMGMNHQPFMPVQSQMGMPPPSQNPQMNQPNMFTAFMPQQHQMQMQMPLDPSGNPNYASHPQMPPGYAMVPQPQQQQHQQPPPQQQQQQQQQQQHLQQQHLQQHPQPHHQQTSSGGFGRQQKYNRQFNTSGNNTVIHPTSDGGGGRPRKRGRY